MRHLFESSGLFTVLLFPPVPVGFVYCNVWVLLYRMRPSTHLRVMFGSKCYPSKTDWRDSNLTTIERFKVLHWLIT